MVEPRKSVSYGIILFSYQSEKNHTQEVVYQLTQRRDSIAYAEFLKNTLPEEEIPDYIKRMSTEERDRLLTFSNEPLKIWDDLWINHKTRFYREGLDQCLNTLTDRIEKWKPQLIAAQQKEKNYNSWGFAKGRKQKNEYNIHAALREFTEETGIPQNLIKLVDKHPIKEEYKGTDGNIYITFYYIAKIPHIYFTPAKINSILRSYPSVSEEVSKIRWASFTQCLKILDENKRKILREVNSKILKYTKNLPKRRFTCL